jgi:hypothetical protein
MLFLPYKISAGNVGPTYHFSQVFFTMPPLGKFVLSKDGTKIWTHAAGNPAKPVIVFIPGFSCTALAFEKQFDDPKLLENLYLVSSPVDCFVIHKRSPFVSSVMTLADRVRVDSPSKLKITTARDTPTTSRPLLMHTGSRSLLSADGLSDLSIQGSD